VYNGNTPVGERFDPLILGREYDLAPGIHQSHLSVLHEHGNPALVGIYCAFGEGKGREDEKQNQERYPESSHCAGLLY
jgi:hypothetical protein